MVSGSDGIFGRRKSGHLLSRGPSVSEREDESNTNNAGKRRRSSMFILGGSSSAETQSDGGPTSPDLDKSDLTAPKHRFLQKKGPASVFTSLGRKSTNTSERHSDYDNTPPGSPLEESSRSSLFQPCSSTGRNVLHSGEVQTTTGLFRKKREYLVLTDTYLIRFKGQARAAEVFPSLQASNGRGTATRHSSTTSIGSMHDLQSLNSHSSSEVDTAISLKQVVATYKVEDGRPFFTTEVVFLDEETNAVGSLHLILHDPKEADLWHTSIRGAAEKARLMSAQSYPERVVQFLVRILETSVDYDPEHVKIFRVVRRSQSKHIGRSSSDELVKLGSNVVYLITGLYRMHLISLPDFAEPSLVVMDAKASKASYGLVSLVSMDVRHSDDTFELGFRSPLQPPVVLDLAAAAGPEIARCMFQAILFLKPQWLDYTFLYGGPPDILDDSDLPAPVDDDNGWFERTLVAYCMAYNCNPSRIRYTVIYDTEDAPEFRLLPPNASPSYSAYELLAIFRALRFNEAFHSISFQDINLECLHSLFDTNGRDHVAMTTRSGVMIRKHFSLDPLSGSLLYQEVQALAVKAHRLHRLDFSNTLPRREPRDADDEERIVKDPGCEIASAIFPLCRAKLTNVDWIVLNGITLGETDLEELAMALDDKKAQFRSIELSTCGLADRGMQVFLNHVERQSDSIECIDISNNSGRLQLERFPLTMSRFSQLRKLNISRVPCTSGPESLIAPEVMLAWRLEELIMTGFPVNDNTLDSISAYLASHMSDNMHTLQMDQCNLTGAHVALLMRSMSRGPGLARNLHLHVSANRLEKGNNEIVKAIEESLTPTHLTMRMVEYATESRFRQLLHALRVNTTIRSLDISKASLPGDAGDDTCHALQRLFEENETLEELDISGEHAHLEVAKFGIGLSHALMGLKKNKTLRILKIEYQDLGLEGASTLSTVLEENSTLEDVNCEHNTINLQGFTVLVNATAENHTILNLPFMLGDQKEAEMQMRKSLRDGREANSSKGEGAVKHSVRRGLSTLGMHGKEHTNEEIQDIEAAVKMLNALWEQQAERLADFLERNRRLRLGQENSITVGDETLRPVTANDESEDLGHNTSPRSSGIEPEYALDHMTTAMQMSNLHHETHV